MRVIKLGGSLMVSDALRGWLRALAEQPSDWVVVPGGGAFADQVRESQRYWAFDDATAHAMAVLAMEQYGLLMTGLEDSLRPARDRHAIETLHSDARVPVWMPSAMVGDDPNLAHDWSVTSDSLAAWLARELGAEWLLLVKSAAVHQCPKGVISTAVEGIVDDAFPGMIAGSPFCVGILNSYYYQNLEDYTSYSTLDIKG